MFAVKSFGFINARETRINHRHIRALCHRHRLRDKRLIGATGHGVVALCVVDVAKVIREGLAQSIYLGGAHLGASGTLKARLFRKGPDQQDF